MKKIFIIFAMVLLMFSVSCDDYMEDLLFQSKLTEGLVAYWPVTESSGTNIKDYSGNENNLLCTDIAYVEGKFGNAVNFNGTSSQLDVSKNNYFFQKNEFTISMWISSEDYDDVMIFGTSLASVSIIQNGTSLRIMIMDKDENNSWIDIPNILVFNTWMYLTLTYENDSMYLYLNSNLVESFAVPNGVSSAVDDLIFSWGDWRGLLDEIRIYDRALSQEEIEALMDMGVD